MQVNLNEHERKIVLNILKSKKDVLLNDIKREDVDNEVAILKVDDIIELSDIIKKFVQNT